MQKEFYWDNSATTRVTQAVVQAINAALLEDYGNPSSLHRKGVASERLIKGVRQSVAKSLRAKEKEIYFTSGGTESDNLALQGLYHSNKRKGNHVVSSAIEHPAVLKTLEALRSQGASVTLVEPDSTGVISVESVISALCPQTCLVSIMTVNNETGALMDIAGMGRAIKAFDKDILFHSDAVQAYGKMPLSVTELTVDAMSISGHKIHGPKGSGALYLREGVRCVPVIFGGGQESAIRPGTENVPGIAGLGAAVADTGFGSVYREIAPLRERFLAGLEQRAIEYHLNGGVAECVPYIINVSFPGVLSEVLLHTLESKGMYVSTGSACSSKKKTYSTVLEAMKCDEAALESAVRISFSSFNSMDDIEAGLDILAASITEIKTITNRRNKWKR